MLQKKSNNNQTIQFYLRGSSRGVFYGPRAKNTSVSHCAGARTEASGDAR